VKGQSALEAAFEPKKPPATTQLERAILTLLVEGHASYRGIQRCLETLVGVHVSVGKIAAIVQKAGERAQQWMSGQRPATAQGLALDEMYGPTHGQAYLNVVDVHSSQVWATLPAVAVDGESWTLALWYLHEQGVVWTSTVSDGGKAIQEALRTTKALSAHQRDVWHLLHLAAQVQGRVERVVQEEEERWQLIERQQHQQQARMGKKAAGRPAKRTAGEQERLLIQLRYIGEAAQYLFAQLRELLEVVVLSEHPEPRLLSCQGTVGRDAGGWARGSRPPHG